MRCRLELRPLVGNTPGYNEDAMIAAPLIAGTFMILGVGSATLWTLFGTAIRRVLTTGERLVWFNRAMGALLAASITLILF